MLWRGSATCGAGPRFGTASHRRPADPRVPLASGVPKISVLDSPLVQQ